MNVCCIFGFLTVLCPTVFGAKILGVFLFPSISHQIFYQPIWKELSLRGHQVTVLTPSPLNDRSLTNLTEIDLSFQYEWISKLNLVEEIGNHKWLLPRYVQNMHLLAEWATSILLHPDVQPFIRNQTNYFDLVMLEAMLPVFHGFAAIYKVPFIEMFSASGVLRMHDAIGCPTHPVLHPNQMLDPEDRSLLDRVRLAYSELLMRFIDKYYVLPKSDQLARTIFGHDIPFLGDIERNASLMIVNSNPIFSRSRPSVPNIVEVRQIHIKNNGTLPHDIKYLLDQANQGVVYFSLGSNVKSVNLRAELQETIRSALSELPYLVLWKWETEHLPNKPKNVITRKWLPQQAILDHPNIKVFLTQGGLQSVEEAISKAVPMVGIPFITDHAFNLQTIVDLGIGIKLDAGTLDKNMLKSAILEVAQNPKYKKRISELSAVIGDQQVSGLETAVWWIEHVLRHNGALHLRSPSLDMPSYQYYLLDVIGITFLALAILSYSIYKAVQIILLFTTKYCGKKLKKL